MNDHIIFKEFKPSETLQPFVKCYSILEYNLDEDKILTNHFIPFGSPYLGIPYRGWLDISPSNFKSNKFNNDHVAGQVTTYMYHRHSGNSGQLGVFFHPAGFCNLFRQSMTELTHNAIDVYDVFGSKGERLIWDIRETTSHEHKIKLVDKFLKEKLNRMRYFQDVTDNAISMILQNSSQSIDNICRYLGITSRHLRRKFKEKVGIGPKLYLRICRFHQAIKLSRMHPQFDLQDIVYQCGYYDQSHFSNDFKRFAGEKPSTYFKRNTRGLELGGIHGTN